MKPSLLLGRHLKKQMRKYHVRMKNLTLRLDEKVLTQARKIAARRGTTVAKVVREYLTNYVRAHGDELYHEHVRLLSERRSSTPGFSDWPAQYENQVVPQISAFRSPSPEEMTADTGADPEPGHDEWFRRQVQKTLDKKKAGNLKNRDLRDVAAEFGFNAR